MHIVICSSIDFTPQIEQVSLRLKEMGHKVELPLTSQKIIDGKTTLDAYFAEKSTHAGSARRKIEDDVIRSYYKKIKAADAIFVLNFEKKGIKDYIGGNTFLEMGFAHVLNKRIYLYHPIPELSYTDEIMAFEPVVVDEDLSYFNT